LRPFHRFKLRIALKIYAHQSKLDHRPHYHKKDVPIHLNIIPQLKDGFAPIPRVKVNSVQYHQPLEQNQWRPNIEKHNRKITKEYDTAHHLVSLPERPLVMQDIYHGYQRFDQQITAKEYGVWFQDFVILSFVLV
jgi:hypothetical protein